MKDSNYLYKIQLKLVCPILPYAIFLYGEEF